MRIKKPFATAINLIFNKAPLEAQLIVTRRCNLTCGYCTEFDNVSDPVPLNTLKERIDALHRLKVINLSILGGEPLMHPDLPEIVRYGDIHSQVSITTNGFLITIDLIKKLNESGLANMEVSIDDLEFDKTGFIQKTMKTVQPKLELLKKHAKFDVHVNLVLCERTKNRFKATLDEFKKMGLRVAIDLLHKPTGEVDIRGQEYVELWEHHFKNGTPFTYFEYEYGKALLLGENPTWKCRSGSRSLYIDEFGKVQYCSSQRGRLNKNVTEYTLQDLDEQHNTFKGCESSCGMLCVYRDSILDNQPFHTVKGVLKTFQQGVINNNATTPVTA